MLRPVCRRRQRRRPSCQPCWRRWIVCSGSEVRVNVRVAVAVSMMDRYRRGSLDVDGRPQARNRHWRGDALLHVGHGVPCADDLGRVLTTTAQAHVDTLLMTCGTNRTNVVAISKHHPRVSSRNRSYRSSLQNHQTPQFLSFPQVNNRGNICDTARSSTNLTRPPPWPRSSLHISSKSHYAPTRSPSCLSKAPRSSPMLCFPPTTSQH